MGSEGTVTGAHTEGGGSVKTVQPSAFAVFSSLEGTVECIKLLRESGYTSLEVFSPVPDHALRDAMPEKESPVKAFTLSGAILGFCIGWGITLGPLGNFSLHVGGKPLESIPPFAVVAYICTILFGAIATVMGFALSVRLPSTRLVVGYDPRITCDHYGIHVPCEPDEVGRVMTLMKMCGADTIREIAKG